MFEAVIQLRNNGSMLPSFEAIKN